MRFAIVVAVAALAAACSSPAPPARPTGDELVAQVASYDLAVGLESRFLVGLLTPDNREIAGGTAHIRFFFLGERQAEGSPELVQEADATFLPIPEEEHEAGHEGAPHARGVFDVPRITFDRAGIWQAEVTVTSGGDRLTGTAAFTVAREPAFPAPGQRAIPIENPTIGSDVPEQAIDSRATLGPIPDPELHRVTVAEAIRAHRPAVVVFSTPVYCQSRFCGPVTDMVQGLAGDYGDVADFIHVEVWRDFQKQVVNESAAAWILRGGDLLEPWVFLIGPDGRILERWDNVATREEIVPWLERLR
jgi:hypothetical protein